MENSLSADHYCEQKDLKNELKQGKELARQLQIHLNVPSSTHETREFLVHKILSSYDKALSMLNCSTSLVGDQQHITGGSPRSEDSDRDFIDPDNKDASRKRKAMPRWTKQVQVCPGTGLERPLDDSYSWRKYGQKDILGAKFPRGYYKCTHRNIQGCLATKQVQRSDDDPTIFEITYRGRHTCTQASLLTPASISSPEKPQAVISLTTVQQQLIQQPQQNQPKELLLNFQTGLKVITEDFSTGEQSNNPPLYFPSTSKNEAENYVFSQYMSDSNLVGNLSASFVSPATSGSNYNLSVSPSNVSSFGRNFQNLGASDSELNETISAATSATNSPTVGFDIPFGQVEFNSNFTFDNPGFFS